jgi:hypothetical protein
MQVYKPGQDEVMGFLIPKRPRLFDGVSGSTAAYLFSGNNQVLLGDKTELHMCNPLGPATFEDRQTIIIMESASLIDAVPSNL